MSSCFSACLQGQSSLESVIAFIYDIPRKDVFSNKTMTEYFSGQGFKGC